MNPQLCLGTAQFGLAYGITNSAGQVNADVVKKLLKEAARFGINWLDTAHAYGNAETVLGQNLKSKNDFRLISKLPAQSKLEFTEEDRAEWEKALNSSFKSLNVKSLNSFLLHSARDLTKPGSHHLREWLLGIRKRGLTERIGVSIYTAEDLDSVDQELLDIVQLPLSLYDQRMLENGTVARLSSSGIAVHARSIYMQGLLLTPAAKWPKWVDTDIRAHQKDLEDLARKKRCRLIDLAIGFAREQKDLECVVLGVCNSQELEDLHKTWFSTIPWREGEWRNWAIRNSDIVDPRNWPA